MIGIKGGRLPILKNKWKEPNLNYNWYQFLVFAWKFFSFAFLFTDTSFEINPIALIGTSSTPKYRQDLFVVLEIKVLNYTNPHVSSCLNMNNVLFYTCLKYFDLRTFSEVLSHFEGCLKHAIVIPYVWTSYEPPLIYEHLEWDHMELVINL